MAKTEIKPNSFWVTSKFNPIEAGRVTCLVVNVNVPKPVGVTMIIEGITIIGSLWTVPLRLDS